ncbi:hypothetical protein CB1_000125003 [Camelus ferus]|nr:hypothetical protein CB1_000125003 [Camelus ferus]
MFLAPLWQQISTWCRVNPDGAASPGCPETCLCGLMPGLTREVFWEGLDPLPLGSQWDVSSSARLLSGDVRLDYAVSQGREAQVVRRTASEGPCGITRAPSEGRPHLHAERACAPSAVHGGSPCPPWGSGFVPGGALEEGHLRPLAPQKQKTDGCAASGTKTVSTRTLDYTFICGRAGNGLPVSTETTEQV